MLLKTRVGQAGSIARFSGAFPQSRQLDLGVEGLTGQPASIHPSNTIRLSDFERERWGREAESLAPVGNQPNNEFLAAASSVARHHVTLAMAEQLAAVTQHNGPLFRVIENLPIDDPLPPAPTDGKRPAEKLTWISETVLLGATRSIGLEVFTYQQERGGAWPQQVAPIIGRETGNHSGNKDELGFHADNAILASEHGAEFIALLGLQNEKGTETWLVSIDDLLTELDRRSRSFTPVLADNSQWQVPFPESFEMGPDRTFSNPCAILTTGAGGQNQIAVALYNVRPLSKDAEDAIEGIKSILKVEESKANGEASIVQKVVLRPGTMLLMNNFRGLHGRGQIGGARWAQRIYLGRSLESLQSACGTGDDCRVFDVRKLRHK